MRKKLKYTPIDGTLALLDADIILYRVGFSTQDVSKNIALSRLNAYIDEILFNSGASDYICYLTGSNNYRKTLYPEYKANRVQEKPLHYHLLKQYLIDHEAAILEEDQEADDALGIAQTAGNDTTIICSIDKDLHQIPGRHFNFVKNIHYTITPEEGRRNFWRQVLTGDAVDNIKGLPKVGPVKANKYLEGCVTEEEYKSAVFSAYMDKLPDLSEQAILDRISLTGRLVYIRRKPEEIWRFEWQR